ncbi:MAG: glycosyltransferase family 2 protein [Methanomassiliicoccales archaeon]|nr:MAG: glycosyltransferase family 2 protein [Methanomassiliicoccales archaeon]
MKAVVMIPAYNEEKTIGHVIKGIPRNFADEVKVLVINDGSQDNTVGYAKRAGADDVVSHKRNKGLGHAFRTGIDNALRMGADVIVNIDADGQFDPRDIPRLVKPIVDKEADMVTCTRFAGKAPKMPKVKKFGNKRFTNLVNRFTGEKFTDTQCGFRAYSKEAALRLTLFGGHTYTQEVFLNLVFKGMQIKEVPCKVKGEREGKSRVVGSISGYSLRSLLLIIRAHRDFRPLKFFGRLGLVMFVPGVVIGIVLGLRLLLYNVISPYLSLVYIGVVLIVVGALLLVMALIADMYTRQRLLQEEILYRLKKREYE